MKKNVYISLIFESLFVLGTLLLIIFCMPDKIPMHIDINQQIDSLFSKWFILIALALSVGLIISSILTKNKIYQKLINVLWFLTIFETLLASLYYSFEPTFNIGDFYKIPMGIAVGLPVSLIIITWANLLKNIPYKSKLGIKNKFTLETEFLWKQIHYDAKDKFFAAGFLLMLISIIFCLFTQNLIFLITIIFILLITNFFIFKQAKAQYNKYIEMKTRKENQEKTKK